MKLNFPARLAALVMTAAMLLTIPVSAAVTVTLDGYADYQATHTVLEIENQKRAAQGLAPLELDAALTEAAMQRAAELVYDYSNTRPNGQSIQQLHPGIAASIYYNTTANAATIGQRFSQTAGVTDSQYRSTGIAHLYVENSKEKHYWVQFFSKQPAGSGSVPTDLQAKTFQVTLRDGLIPYNAAGPNLTWSLEHYDDGLQRLVFTGSGKMWNYGRLDDCVSEEPPWKGNYYATIGSVHSVTLPEGLTAIGSYAFNGAMAWDEALKLPEGLTYIGNNAFERCNLLKGTLVLPKGLTYIGSNAFYNCYNLRCDELYIPEGMTSISNQAFIYCSGLKGSLYIPANVSHIGFQAFHGTRFTDVYFAGNAPILGDPNFATDQAFPENVTIHYDPNTSGWDVVDGKWNGYTAQPMAVQPATLTISQEITANLNASTVTARVGLVDVKQTLTGNLWFVFYDGDGRMACCKTLPINTGSDISFDVVVPCQDPASVKTARAFLLDDDFVPLLPASR